MARKSTKRARFDSLTQREQNRERKRKQNAGRKDAGRWASKVLDKLKEADVNEQAEENVSETESTAKNV
ncbi:hypothetical protein [Psychrobacillus sp. FSL K6-1415]|uniref:hypothetical protein n=1 Tax=Psychrobacillus sp. FSL K6-1415 TaxID=2921544 RepID=UPI0030FCEEFA